MTAALVGLAMLLAVLAFAPAELPRLPGVASLFSRAVRRRELQLQAARIPVDALRFTLVAWLTPALLVLIGLGIGSPPMAVLAGAGGLVLPRFYLDTVVQSQRRRSESEAPRMLQVLVASLAAGRTYLDTLEEVRERVRDRWLRDDLAHIIAQFYLDVPIEQSIAEVRGSAAGPNLRLVWDNLAICVGNRIPVTRAKGLFVELSEAVQFNVQVQQEIRARTSGQRAQIWMLAVIVPALFLYLRFVNPEFFTVLDTTMIGRFVLFPLSAGLEVLGLYLSIRLSRVEV